MKGKGIKKALKVIGWVLLSLLSLILIVTLVFYLSRGWILEKVLSRVNEEQPGEITMGRMNLVPFLRFPDVSLQLKDVHYFEVAGQTDTLQHEALLSLGEIYVSLDVLALIRGDIEVSELRLERGYIRGEMYSDSSINFERALGISLLATGMDTLAADTTMMTHPEGQDAAMAETASADTSAQTLPAYRVDLDRIALHDILLTWEDVVNGEHLSLQVNSLESGFRYFSDSLRTRLKLDIDLNHFKYLSYRSEKPRNIQLDTEISIDLEDRKASMEPSSMKFSGLEMEASGNYDFMDVPRVEVDFRAVNEGLDVLNFLFRGILDMDEIEQIGGGRISLDGSIAGQIADDALPQVSMNARAEDLGFSIRAIDRDVTDISFRMEANSGESRDLTDARIDINGFTARSPEGMFIASLSAVNVNEPELKVELTGDVLLDGLDQIVEVEGLEGLRGHVRVDGRLEGRMDSLQRFSLKKGAGLLARLDSVGCDFNGDEIRGLSGEIFVEGDTSGLSALSVVYNGDSIDVDVKATNLTGIALGEGKDLSVQMEVAAGLLHPHALTGDSSLVEFLGEEISGMEMSAMLFIPGSGVRALIDKGEIPPLELRIDSTKLKIPMVANLSGIGLELKLGADTLDIEAFRAVIGESDLQFSGRLVNYAALMERDTGGVIDLAYALKADKLRAVDVATINDSFLLPEPFRAEQVEDFSLSGQLLFPLAGMLDSTAALSADLKITDLGARLLYYPHELDDFHLALRLDGEDIFLDDFSGSVGESNLQARAEVYSFRDTSMQALHGNLFVASDLLDIDALQDYRLPGLQPVEDSLKFEGDSLAAESQANPAQDAAELQDTVTSDTAIVSKPPPDLQTIDFPDFDFDVNIRELRVSGFNVSGISGRLRSTRDRIFYLDSLTTSGGSGGKIAFNGQFNASDPLLYNLSAALSLREMDVNELDIEMESEEGSYQLKDNFQGVISADGLAEFFITPELNLDMSMSTAVFNYRIDDGALINFEPLEAASRFLDGKDLGHVKFGTLRNSFPMSLVDGRIMIPLTVIESTAGQLLIEGEQGLDGSFMYLLRMPTELVWGAVASVLGDADDKKEDEISRYERGKFVVVTVYSDGKEVEVKMGDKRDKFLE